MSDISRRKDDHLDLAARGEVGFRAKTTLLECVHLVHDALPELALDEVDLSTRLLGKQLRVPIIIAGMTGGSARAGAINRELAAIAEERGYGFGLGSQRAMLRDPEQLASYAVRDVAPGTLILGNIGAVQAVSETTERLGELAAAVGADALCVHLNPAMEVVQPGGDRDFRGVLETFRRLSAELPVPVVAKETGCGLSAGAARRLKGVGVQHVDVSGAGGTSWVGVETRRASGETRALGETFWDWGIPTAASVALVATQGFRTVIATGGVSSGADVAHALALGASAAGIARPVLQAFDAGGRAATLELLDRIELELRTILLLVGARSPRELQHAPRVIVGELRDWIAQVGLARS